jgi:hypothetical protein
LDCTGALKNSWLLACEHIADVHMFVPMNLWTTRFPMN